MTGVRGIAALWVMFYHAQLVAGDFNMPFLTKIPSITHGWQGVDLFFMLSGFILMYAHERDFHRIRRVSVVRFAWLRFARVYPLNTVVLFLILALVVSQPHFVAWIRSTRDPADFSAGAFLRTLFLATRWFLPGKGDWNGPTWSLSFEILGYMMFPWLAFCASRIVRKWQLILVSTIGLLGSLGLLQAMNHPLGFAMGQSAILRMLSCFITGIAVFRLWALTEKSRKNWPAWLAALSAIGIVIAGLFPHGPALFNFFFASLLYGLSFQRGIIAHMLSTRGALFLGKISFPLYLVHGVALTWTRYLILSSAAIHSPFERSTALVLWVIGCISLATLLHYYVERPFHAWGRRWSQLSITSRALRQASLESLDQVK